MRALLTACVELNTLAIDVYALFAEATGDAELADVFRQLQEEEREHLRWWAEVSQRLDAGELPVAQTALHVTAYMNAIVSILKSMLDAIPRSLSDDDMLALAASLEFFALDPVFGELIRHSDPVSGNERLREYDEHIAILVETMEARHSWSLAPHIALLKATSGERAEFDSGASHDTVTGLPKRRVAEEAITDLCSDSQRDDEPISVALLEVNLAPLYEKDPVNAERELLHVVSAITSLTRLTDLFARVDSHRFALVMPSTSADAARAIVSKIVGEVSAIVTSASGGIASEWLVAAVAVLPPRCRRDAHAVFSAAEDVLGGLHATGESVGVRELS